MAIPEILVREFGVSGHASIVPAMWTEKYKDLERAAYTIYDKDANSYSVHFHHQDNKCHGILNNGAWDAKAYFTEHYIEDGGLHLYAHFEGTREEGALPPTSQLEARVGAISPGVSGPAYNTRAQSAGEASFPPAKPITPTPGSSTKRAYDGSGPAPDSTRHRPLHSENVQATMDQDPANSQFVSPVFDVEGFERRDLLENGITIGYVCKELWKFPNARPVVRLLATSKQMFCYTSAKWAINSRHPNWHADFLVGIRQVDLLEKFGKYEDADERRAAMRKAYVEKNGALAADNTQVNGVADADAEPEVEA